MPSNLIGVPDAILRTTYVSLDALSRREPQAFGDLAAHAWDRDRALPDSSRATLQHWALVDALGNVHAAVRAVVASVTTVDPTGARLLPLDTVMPSPPARERGVDTARAVGVAAEPRRGTGAVGEGAADQRVPADVVAADGERDQIGLHAQRIGLGRQHHPAQPLIAHLAAAVQVLGGGADARAVLEQGRAQQRRELALERGEIVERNGPAVRQERREAFAEGVVAGADSMDGHAGRLSPACPLARQARRAQPRSAASSLCSRLIELMQ